MFDLTLLHPKVVHFTVALFTLSVLFDLLGVITRKESFHTAGWLNLIFAGAAGVVTVVAGLLAESRVPHVDSAHELMETHETLGYIVLGSILLLLLWRIILKGKFPAKTSILYLILGLGGLGVMFTGAYYGGELVYTHGVAVKAVPVSEAEAGHHHGEGESHEPGQTMEKMMQDTTQMKMMKQDSSTVHKHNDGSEHVHKH